VIKNVQGKRNKNDAADAAAICEAVTRPTMRFVSVKTTEQQSILMLHRTNELLTRQRTMLINAIRAHMTEFGIVAPTGVPQVRKLFRVIADTDDTYASDDYLVPPGYPRDVAKNIPGARTRRFASGGHHFPVTRAGRFNRVLRDFFKSAENQTRA
jgi:pimeloyl-ACP methyl ester carboxylesterase